MLEFMKSLPLISRVCFFPKGCESMRNSKKTDGILSLSSSLVKHTIVVKCF